MPFGGLNDVPLNFIIIIINDSIYPAVSKASRTGNKVSCQPNDCPILGVKLPKNSNFGGVNRTFKPERQKFQTLIT